MEAIITLVGFLGAGKTTLLKTIIENYISKGWRPFIILNDYQNAYIDAQQFYNKIDKKYVSALSGSCICCSGINELRDYVNNIPKRENGITIIEANGTSDACSLMGFLGVGLNERFLPPVQVSVVDVKNWQKRGEYNDLESNQVQVSSLIILTHLENETNYRKQVVINGIKKLNPLAKIITMEDIDVDLLPKLVPSNNNFEKLEHLKSHWSSCSVDLPDFPSQNTIREIIKNIPESILRVKGFTNIVGSEGLTFFERTADGEFYTRPFRGTMITDPKLLVIGPGSDPNIIKKIVDEAIVLSSI